MRILGRPKREIRLPRRSVPGNPAPAPMRIVVLLALLTAVGPISTDMYLPAFPAMRAALNGSAGDAQLTLAAWFVGLAVGQVTYGPLADHWGRRTPLLSGIALYTLASLGCALATSMAELSIFRFVAAFGGAAGLVIPRAVIRDLATDGVSAARLMGRLILVTGVVPMLAPTAGGLIEMQTGWRMIFVVATVYGIVCTGLIWRFLPDTLPPHARRRFRMLPVVMRYQRVWRDRIFRLHALQGGAATFSLFAFLGGAPPVFLVHYGLDPTTFGTLFIFNAAGYVVGAQANARLSARYDLGVVLRRGTDALLFCTLLMLGAILAGVGNAAVIAVLFVGVMMTLGFVLPGAALGSLLTHPREAGSASALYGTTVFVIGAVATYLAGRFDEGAPVAMAILMTAGAGAAVVIDRIRTFAGRAHAPQVSAASEPRDAA